MIKIDRWLPRITLPVIAAALVWQTWVRPTAAPAPNAVVRTTGAQLQLVTENGPVCIESSADPFADRGVSPAPDTRLVGWSELRSYQYQPALAALPSDIKSLDGQRVTIAGYLLPLFEFENIREFGLVGSRWPSFGVTPGLNGIVRVRLRTTERGLSNTQDPLRVAGTFHAKEERKDGHVISIYEIEDGTVSAL